MTNLLKRPWYLFLIAAIGLAISTTYFAKASSILLNMSSNIALIAGFVLMILALATSVMAGSSIGFLILKLISNNKKEEKDEQS